VILPMNVGTRVGLLNEDVSLQKTFISAKVEVLELLQETWRSQLVNFTIVVANSA